VTESEGKWIGVESATWMVCGIVGLVIECGCGRGRAIATALIVMVVVVVVVEEGQCERTGVLLTRTR